MRHCWADDSDACLGQRSIRSQRAWFYLQVDTNIIFVDQNGSFTYRETVIGWSERIRNHVSHHREYHSVTVFKYVPHGQSIPFSRLGIENVHRSKSNEWDSMRVPCKRGSKVHGLVSKWVSSYMIIDNREASRRESLIDLLSSGPC